jgi:hypothetical protein
MKAEENNEKFKAMNLRRPSFHALPPEIRFIIYKECLATGTGLDTTAHPGYQRPVQNTPPLIIALRPDPALYHEALVIFYTFNVFIVSKNNFDDLSSDLSERALAMVRQLHIKVEYVPCL